MFAGYYTETYQAVSADQQGGQQSMESTDVESEEEVRYHAAAATSSAFPTLLPANFPTFDSPTSSPRLGSGTGILQLGAFF